MRPGYVYLLVHPATPEWVKVGHTRDLDARLTGYQTSDPLRRFQYAAAVFVENARAAETEVLAELCGLAEEQRCEWFRMRVGEALKHLRRITEGTDINPMGDDQWTSEQSSLTQTCYATKPPQPQNTR